MYGLHYEGQNAYTYQTKYDAVFTCYLSKYMAHSFSIEHSITFNRNDKKLKAYKKHLKKIKKKNSHTYVNM